MIGYILGLLVVFLSWFDGLGFLIYAVLGLAAAWMVAASIHGYSHKRRRRNPTLWGRIVRFRNSRWPKIKNWLMKGLWICGVLVSLKFVSLTLNSWIDEVTVWPVRTGPDLSIEKEMNEVFYYTLTIGYTLISSLILIVCIITLLEKTVLNKNKLNQSCHTTPASAPR